MKPTNEQPCFDCVACYEKSFYHFHCARLPEWDSWEKRHPRTDEIVTHIDTTYNECERARGSANCRFCVRPFVRSFWRRKNRPPKSRGARKKALELIVMTESSAECGEAL